MSAIHTSICNELSKGNSGGGGVILDPPEGGGGPTDLDCPSICTQLNIVSTAVNMLTIWGRIQVTKLVKKIKYKQKNASYQLFNIKIC